MFRKSITTINSHNAKSQLDTLLKNDFEHFHKNDRKFSKTHNNRADLVNNAGYLVNKEHPVKDDKAYRTSTLSYLIDNRTYIQIKTKRYIIFTCLSFLDSPQLTDAIATLARSGPYASNIKVIIETKGIGNINWNDLIKLKYAYKVEVIDRKWFDDEGYYHVDSHDEWRIGEKDYSIMELAAIENNTLFFETVLAEYFKAQYDTNSRLSPIQIDDIERALLTFLNHSTAHRHCIANSLYGAHQRALTDLHKIYPHDFDISLFNDETRHITQQLTRKLNEHVYAKSLKIKTAWILSFTVCLLLPVISHIIVWAIYFYQQHTMDFQTKTISLDRYIQYLNRKGKNVDHNNIHEYLDTKTASRPAKPNHGCGKDECHHTSHRFRIPKQVTIDGNWVHVRTTFWNGQTTKFRKALKALGPDPRGHALDNHDDGRIEADRIGEQISASQSAIPSAPPLYPEESAYFNPYQAPPNRQDYIDGASAPMLEFK